MTSLIALLADPAGLLAFSVVAGIGVLLLAAWASRLLPVHGSDGPAFPLVYARATAFLRQRDPDAAGRPRPRAPSLSPASC